MGREKRKEKIEKKENKGIMKISPLYLLELSVGAKAEKTYSTNKAELY
jgi:hypothetical protein